MKALLLLVSSILILSLRSEAQEKCGTMMLPQNLTYHSDQAEPFELWLEQKRQERQLRRSTLRLSEEEITIPVVIHVIHSGQSVGNGGNIPSNQVISQIETLNADFRRTNSDANKTFGEFLPAATDAMINFQLAVRDPEGLPTTGIVRVEGNQPNYSLSSGQALSDLSYWPAEDYLNIWVTDLSSGLLGYAQFPVSNLIGLDIDRVSNPLTDGVVIDYEYFGTGFNADDFSQGRTATHEIGHYLGLRHIWGDGICGATDYCDDTPDQERSTSGCPTEPPVSCDVSDMNQNYMDYTDDLCMNLFTSDQKERMHTILENSPRRVSLANSPGLIVPTLFDNDLGIRQMVSLYNSSCSEVLSPIVEVRNYGNDIIQDFELQLLFNGQVIEELQVGSANLSFRGLQLVQFSDASLTGVGPHSIEVRIKSVNNATDDNPENDNLAQSLNHTIPVTGDFFTDFESPNDWVLQSESALIIANAPNELSSNTAAKFDFFESEEALGKTSRLVSPVIKLNPSSNPRLEFKYSYNHPAENLAEAMFVLVSTDCGLTYLPENTAFQSYGQGLNSSNQPADQSYTPAGPNEWKTASVNLLQYLEDNFIRIAFVGQNGLGNNLYIDDILISAGPNADYDVSIEEIADYPFVTCENEMTAQVTVSNNGNNSIREFDLTYYINGMESNSILYEGVNLDPFERTTVPLNLSNLPEGELLQIDIEVNLIDNEDLIPENNQGTLFGYFDQSEISFPYRLDLNQPDWFSYSPEGQSRWDFTNEYASISFDTGTSLNEDFWLVSPTIYPQLLDGLSMSFEVAYPHLDGKNDVLIVSIDRDCDGIFEQELSNKSGGQLATAEYTAGWQPSEDDWRRESIDLDNFLIFDEVRLAFKAVSQQGTAIYLRNIELFESSGPSIGIPTALRVYPNPATDQILVKFNLEKTEPATIRLIDMKGQVLFDKTFENTLNQTYELITANENNGMYLMQIITPSFKSTQRVIIWH